MFHNLFGKRKARKSHSKDFSADEKQIAFIGNVFGERIADDIREGNIPAEAAKHLSELLDTNPIVRREAVQALSLLFNEGYYIPADTLIDRYKKEKDSDEIDYLIYVALIGIIVVILILLLYINFKKKKEKK